MSWKPEIEVSWAPGTWYAPRVVTFETELEAQNYADWLLIHFEITTRARAASSENPVSHQWRNGDLIYIGDKLRPKSEAEGIYHGLFREGGR